LFALKLHGLAKFAAADDERAARTTEMLPKKIIKQPGVYP
jgi:hypothetical protein